MGSKDTKISKKLSYHLRHRPDELDLEMDFEGWVNIKDVLTGLKITREELDRVVATNSKKRFKISGNKIRASQGHTWKSVKLSFPEKTPPDLLYHGTTHQRFNLIYKSGAIKKMERHHVHLSSDFKDAMEVGKRHRNETAKVILIDAKTMLEDGKKFYLSDNNVWLTEEVEVKYFSYLQIDGIYT